MGKEDSERLDRLENHFKIYKSDVEDIKTSVREIRLLLGGSELNGHRGFVKLMEVVENKVSVMESQIVELVKENNTTKFWGRTAVTTLLLLIGVIIRKIFYSE